MHKTGTTFLQRNVFNKVDEINFVTDRTIHNLSRRKHSTLISSERLSGVGYKGCKEIYADQIINNIINLKNTFRQAKLIIGFREPSSLINSLYKQFLHEGGVLKFEDFLRVNNYVLQKGDLLNIIDELKHSYGKDNYLIYLQEDLKRDPKLVLAQFTEYLNLSKPIHLKEQEGKEINKSVPDNLEGTLIFLNKLNRKLGGRLNNILLKKLNLSPRYMCQNFLPKFIPSRETRDMSYIKDEFQEEWEFIKNKYRIQ